jgi:hypothetical protein
VNSARTRRTVSNALEDLRKAAWYVQREIERRERDAPDSPRCHCGAYPVDPDHCLTLFDRDDTAVERHAVGACEGGA